MEFYDHRAVSNKRWHGVFSVYILSTSVAIAPILAIDLLVEGVGKITAAILAPTVALATGLASKFGFHDHWLSYRATWDALQHEVHWHDASVGPYKGVQDRNALFVERVEQLISREGTDWLARQASIEQRKETEKKRS
jgi:hypothetical protein